MWNQSVLTPHRREISKFDVLQIKFDIDQIKFDILQIIRLGNSQF